MKPLQRMSHVLQNATIKFLENILSKKFLVFITATILMSLGLLPPDLWVAVALAVLGVVSAIDYKHGSRSFESTSTETNDSTETEPTQIL